jgi:hypothetical protein
LPMLEGLPKDNRKDLNNVELLVFLSRRFPGKAEAVYACDDGESFAFENGARSAYRIEAWVRLGKLHLRIDTVSEGFGAVRFSPVTMEKFEALYLEVPGGSPVRLKAEAFTRDAWGAPAVFYAWR